MSAEQKKPYEKRSVEAGKKYENEMAEYRKVSGVLCADLGGGLNSLFLISLYYFFPVAVEILFPCFYSFVLSYVKIIYCASNT